jgi:hypothetical protein
MGFHAACLRPARRRCAQALATDVQELQPSMHLIRFLVTVVLIELVVLLGVALERQQLVVRSRMSAQVEQIEQVKQQRAKLLLRIGQLSAAPRIIEEIDAHPAYGGSGQRER